MALMTWSDSFSVKVKLFDEQHKKLVDMINNLHEFMKQGKGADGAKQVLNSLITYTQTHFAEEEKYMTAHGYPDLAAHKREHTNLITKASAIKKDIDSGKMLITQDLMLFLKDWLVKHIQGEDKKYGPFFNGKGIS